LKVILVASLFLTFFFFPFPPYPRSLPRPFSLLPRSTPPFLPRGRLSSLPVVLGPLLPFYPILSIFRPVPLNFLAPPFLFGSMASSLASATCLPSLSPFPLLLLKDLLRGHPLPRVPLPRKREAAFAQVNALSFFSSVVLDLALLSVYDGQRLHSP